MVRSRCRAWGTAIARGRPVGSRILREEASCMRLATGLAADRCDLWAMRRCIIPASPNVHVTSGLKTPRAA